MIGTWRWLLALLVVIGHLFEPWWPASFGVFSFYIVSGFLMTLIMNEHYGFNMNGLKGFWLNRFLRLYPAYYMAATLSLMLLFFIPNEFIHGLNKKLTLPDTPFEIVANFTIFGLIHRDGINSEQYSSLVPPAWALSIELFYYFVISIWAGKSRNNAHIFLAMGLTYLVLVIIFLDKSFYYRYFFIGAGALPFAIGVNVYFYKSRIEEIFLKNGFLKLSIFVLYILNYLCGYILGLTGSIFFYFNIITSALMLVMLCNFKNIRLKKVDSFLGDLSYPTYLIHWQLGIFVAYISGFHFKGIEVFIISFVLVFIISVLESRFISGPIEKYRKSIKSKISRVSLLSR